MKKAKIVLSAVALFAVVGGAFAFKARTAQHIFYTKNAASPFCTVPTLLNYTTSANPTTTIPYATTTTVTICSARVVSDL
jgi:hypothetical protein